MALDEETSESRFDADEQAIIDAMEEWRGRELTEQEKNVAVLQAKLVGEI